MRPLLFCLLLLLLQTPAQAQRLDTTRYQNMSDRELGLTYLKKSKNQKTAGWIMLGAGAGMHILGLSNMQLFSEQTTMADIAAVVGFFSIIGSVPMFISSARNKGRAEILLRNQNVPLSGRHHIQVPALTLRIPAGR